MKNGIRQMKGTGRERVYDFLADYIQKNGYAPSIREICVGANLRSTSSVYAHLLKLEDEGKIYLEEHPAELSKIMDKLELKYLCAG